MQPFSADMSRKQRSKESMAAALQDVRGGMSVREAAKLYNLPFETLRRRVVGKVDLECRSGPPTVLTEHEDELGSYCVKMSDMGFGLSRTDVMAVAFKVAEASGRSIPLEMVLLVGPGLTVLEQDILDSPCVPPNRCLVHGHPVPIMKSSPIFLANWRQCVRNCIC